MYEQELARTGDEQTATDAAIRRFGDPESLARELPLAQAAGYRVLRVQPVDMFPHTPHVEAVAVLERVAKRPPASRRKVAASRATRGR